MTEPTKTVSAGGVILNAEGLILIVSQHGTSWSLPKGHIEDGEAVLEAAKREIWEETGITELNLVKFLGEYDRYKIGKDPHSDDQSELKTIKLYLFRTSQEKLSSNDPDNPEARWVDRDEVSSYLTHPKDKAFFESIKIELT